ncbi:MAG: hypothetical protein R3275_12730, partial [Saprospiraceae bacterium]|nr:hypothetical protein [Saprospiraceae bacterium]
MKHILSLLILLGPLTLISQTQYLDQYEGIFITSANTTATQDQGWVTVADVKLDSITQRLAVIKFDMCGDIQWSNFYSSENAEFHHAEIIQNGSQGYHITCSDEDLSKGPQGVYMIELNSNGMVTSAIQHSTEGQMISGYFIGTDMAIINNTDILTEYETDNGNKALALFDEDEEVVWSKSYDGLPNMASPMAIEAINDSMVFVTNTFQVALMDTLGEVIWSMKNDSVVIWPEIAYLEDNTIGILVSPLKVDSVERAESRRYTYLVTFPQATPFPVMHKGDTKLLDFFPELHAVDGNFVVTSIDTIPEIESYAQTFLVYDKNGDVIEQKYLADYLTSGPLDSMPWIGFDYRSGSGYLTYADADSSVYFSKVGASLEVEDMMACMPETRDSLLDELLSYWVDNPVTVDSIMTTVDSAEVMSEPMDTLIPMRQCENMIPDNELMRPICPGDSILIGGIWRKEEGTYMDTTIICGEEVITTYEVTFIMIPDINIDTSFCPGEEELRFTQFGNVRVITEPG